ncbi:uncharacterized protein [Triticum aestivum]|nr:uncharacterized protein LOC123186767 [Triticum aestivum]
MERTAMPMAGLFRSPHPSIYAPPPPSPHRVPPIRRATTRIRSSSSSINSESSSTNTNTTTKTATTVKLTYLEFNGWLWELDGGRFRVLVDPLLVGNLDFGMPWLFDGAKKTLPKDGLQDLQEDLAVVDLLLITSSLDDHCHVRTLTRLAAISPDLPVVATPNARPILAALPFNDVIYLEPGQSTTVVGATTDSEATVLATPGPVNGPPWQRPENSYMVTTTGKGQRKHNIYYEPHCMYNAGFLRDRGLHADVVITPVVKQQLLATFTLVSGQEDAVELARLLRAAYIVPMSNGECDAKGLLTAVISTQGTTQTFKDLLADALPQTQVVQPTPSVPLYLHFQDDNNTSAPSSWSS